jgi:DNA-binding GntR family transcriptional regulator
MILEYNNRKNRTAADIAYTFIVKKITTGEWAPGYGISENDITQSVGISRTPVREACIRLISENYVEKLPNNRNRVALVSSRQLKEVYKVRSFLEDKIIEDLILHLTETQTNELKRIINYLEVSIQSLNVKETINMMDQFHDYLAIVLNNNILLSTLNVINGHIARYRSLLVSEVSKKDLEAMYHFHKEIYLAILDKNMIEAKNLMLTWNKISYRFLEKTLTKLDYLKENFRG